MSSARLPLPVITLGLATMTFAETTSVVLQILCTRTPCLPLTPIFMQQPEHWHTCSSGPITVLPTAPCCSPLCLSKPRPRRCTEGPLPTSPPRSPATSPTCPLPQPCDRIAVVQVSQACSCLRAFALSPQKLTLSYFSQLGLKGPHSQTWNKEGSWRTPNSWFQNLLQSCSHQKSVVPAQKWP